MKHIGLLYYKATKKQNLSRNGYNKRGETESKKSMIFDSWSHLDNHNLTFKSLREIEFSQTDLASCKTE